MQHHYEMQYFASETISLPYQTSIKNWQLLYMAWHVVNKQNIESLIAAFLIKPSY